MKHSLGAHSHYEHEIIDQLYALYNQGIDKK
jgi:hypothetical protein